MHLQLAARAKTEGVSLNALVLAFIAAEGLGRRHGAGLCRHFIKSGSDSNQTYPLMPDWLPI